MIPHSLLKAHIFHTNHHYIYKKKAVTRVLHEKLEQFIFFILYSLNMEFNHSNQVDS